MRIIIVDDEALARGVVREYLDEYPAARIVAECANGFEAVKAIETLAPDLVLLDIQMPGLDGFEVAGLVAGKTRFIFATAYDQYAIKAFEFHALDYLLKPFSQKRFDQAIEHAFQQLGSAAATPAAAIDAARAEAQGKQYLERVPVREGSKVHVLTCAQIVSIEAQDDYACISAAGRSYLKNQRLSELESQLDPAAFLRVHRSWIVNIGCISRIEQATRDSYVAVLKDDTRVPVSRSGYQKVRALIS
ncbi:response regulator transcription factor [Oxalobacteraceae bacterium]|nr:response regulator transcription factor [Oxalobacteraceae bacterium]